jgi:hypothetical protein
VRGKAPRGVRKKKEAGGQQEACGVETTALSIYLLCGAVGVGLVVRQAALRDSRRWA